MARLFANLRSSSDGRVRFVDLVLIASLSSSLFFTFARFDPDPHHDGIQLATAIGVADGLKVHSQVFSQYGPITPWINGWWLSLTSPTLLSLRYFAALQLIGITILTYLISEKFGIRRSIRIFMVSAWLLSCPVWAYQKWFFSLWPWPSITYTLAILGALYLLIDRRSPGPQDSAWLSIAGLLIGVASFTRPNYGIVLLMVLGFFTFVLRNEVSNRQVVAFTSGFVIPILIALLRLWATDSIYPWLRQSVVGPLDGKASVANFDFSYFYGIYLQGWKELIGLITGLILIARFLKETVLFRALIILVALLVGLKLFTQFNALQSQTWTVQASVTDSMADPLSAMAPIRLALISSGILIPTMFLTCIRRRRGQFNPKADVSPLAIPTLLACAFAGVAQLYPLPDVYHLWWASPPILILCGFMLNSLRRRWLFLTVALFLPTYLLGTVRLREQLEVNRTTWDGGALDGMQIDNDLFQSYYRAAMLLNQIDTPAQFECRDGLWAVFEGRYMSSNPAFVSWAFGVTSTENTAPSNVLCIDGGTAENQVRSTRERTMTTGDESLYFSRFSGDIRIEVWQK